MLVQSMVSESSLDLQIKQLECMCYDRQNAYPVTTSSCAVWILGSNSLDVAETIYRRTESSCHLLSMRPPSRVDVAETVVERIFFCACAGESITERSPEL